MIFSTDQNVRESPSPCFQPNGSFGGEVFKGKITETPRRSSLEDLRYDRNLAQMFKQSWQNVNKTTNPGL